MIASTSRPFPILVVMHRIIIVGGGAGGLELASRLGRRFARGGEARVTLVDESRAHVWKPLLHEVAAGSLNAQHEDVDYLAQATWRHFDFRLGRLEGLDRAHKRLFLAATLDEEGAEIVPRRVFEYDTLIVAVGSASNDFGVPGAARFAHRLDTAEQAIAFNRKLVNACLHAQVQQGTIEPGQLNVVIVGGGATGVELAAELHATTRLLAHYGLDKIDPDRNVRIIVVQASERILKELPERVAREADAQLRKLGIAIYTNERVTQVTDEGVETQSGRFIPAKLVVWAAGIKGPANTIEFDGLEIAGSGQLAVSASLQTTHDTSVFAFGDCAYCRLASADPVPPRAQAAHQQARFLSKALPRHVKGAPLMSFRYVDFGSLLSLGRYTTVGNLMGGLSKRGLFIEGKFAQLMYWSLYKQHQTVLFGLGRTALLTLATWFGQPTRPRVKLH